MSIRQGIIELRDGFGGVDDGSLALPRARFANRHIIASGSFLLLAPHIVFAFGLAALPAIVLLAGSLGYLALLWRAPVVSDSLLARPVAAGRLAACSILSLVLLVLGGETHLVNANWDWLWRDAVLADLTRGPLLPAYGVDGETFLLRAPLGMYELPGLVGRLTDLPLAHVALLVQNTLLLTASLYMLATIAGRRAVAIIVVFIGFSGLDVLGELFFKVGGRDLEGWQLPSHLEWWAGLFQYSSVVTQVFWCPNHALPAYWLAVLALLHSRKDVDLASLAIAAAASLLWSPFAFLGIVPFLAYFACWDARALVASRRVWFAGAVALAFLPIAFYLQADAAQVPHAFILFAPGMALLITVFLVIEIPHVAVIGAGWRDLDVTLKAPTLVAIAVLALLPTIRFGLANDFVMRASIPALMILAVAFGDVLTRAWPDRKMLVAIGAVLAIAGAITPLQEIRRSFAFAPFAISDCNLVTVWKKIGTRQPTLENYLARSRSISPALVAAGRQTPLQDQKDRLCWPDLPIDPYLRITRMTNGELRRSSIGHQPL